MSAIDAKAAIDRGDLAAALESALATWRQTRHPTVAAVIHDLDAQLAFVGSKARTKVDFQKAWLEVAQRRTVDAAGWLARTLTDKVPLNHQRYASLYAGGLQKKYAPFVQRAEALAEWPPDPRIGAGALEVIAASKLNVGWTGECDTVYGSVLRLLEKSLDPAIAAEAHELARTPRSKREAVRRWTTEQCSALVAPEVTDPADLAAWEELAPRSAVDPAAATELLDAIRADPDDRELRGVYADVLQEGADPRGTFIALQLEGNAKAEKKARGLFRKHGTDWLGPDLSRVLTGVEMRDGFLDRAALAQNAAADDAGWRRAYDDPRLATLRRLEKGRGNTRHYTAFVTSPATANLRDVEIPASSVLKALLACEHPRGITSVDFTRLPAPKMLRTLATHSNFRGLTEIGVASARNSSVDELVEKTLAALRKHGLERVTGLRVLPQWGLAYPDSALRLFPSSGLERMTVGYPDHAVHVERTEAGLEIRARGAGCAQVLAVVNALDAPVTRVVLGELGLPGWMNVSLDAIREQLAADHPDTEVTSA